jgi:hypothetical protein
MCGQARRPKYLVLIPYGTTATRFLFHMIFLKNLPLGLFILVLIHDKAPWSVRSKLYLFHDKAPWLLMPPSAGSSTAPQWRGSTMAQLLKAPRRRGLTMAQLLKAAMTRPPPRRWLLHGTGSSMVRPNGNATRQQLWHFKAPWHCGPMTV